MSGFGPFGSFPLASLPGTSGPSGTNYDLTPTSLEFSGYSVTVSYDMPEVHVYSEFMEVVSQSADPPARVYSEFAEAVVQNANPPARVYSEYLEVVVSLIGATASGGGTQISILW